MSASGDAPFGRESLHEIISRFGVAHLASADGDDSDATDLSDEEEHFIDHNWKSSTYEMQGAQPITTLMFKNIPCKITDELLGEELCTLGFAGTYDIVHVPVRRNGSNRGYGFVNFLTADDARCVAEALNGYVFTWTLSTKRCVVTSAAVQGREALQNCEKKDFNPTVQESFLKVEQAMNSQERNGLEPITTLMLKNIPCKLSKELMEEELRQLGFAGTYDVVHVPTRNNGSNKGYGFVNFLTAEDARRVAEALNGYMFTGTRSMKLCCVTSAAMQGRDALLRCAKQERSSEEQPPIVDDKQLNIHAVHDPEPITTLIVNGISNKLTQIVLEEELLFLGFAGTYDVIHVPMRNKRYNKGYAFINLLTADDARRLTEALNGYAFNRDHSTKRCCVTAAGFQGREAMIRRISDSL